MSYNDLTARLQLDCECGEQDSRPHGTDGKSRVSSSGQSPGTTGSRKGSATDQGGGACAATSNVMAENVKGTVVDINNMPIADLGARTRAMLTQYLRPPKEGARDWRGLADELGYSHLQIKNWSLESDPIEKILDEWSTKRGSTVDALLKILESLERDDVLCDIQPYLVKDHERLQRRQEAVSHPIQVPEVSGNYPVQITTQELRGITLQDDPSGPPEMFDAYVCYAEADHDFVMELLRQLESPPHNFKLCIDPRDLVPGGSHALVTAEIISNRCNKMLVVLSPEFLLSESCEFQTKFAVSLDSAARKKRIIPIVVKPCTAPLIIQHITVCDYTKNDLRPWFWDRLKKAMGN